MPESYRIVSASRQHLRDIPRLEQAAATVFPEADLPVSLRNLVTDPAVLREAQAQGRVWMALDQAGRAVGFALAEVLDGEAFLDEVDVEPPHARRGVGTLLVNTVIAWAQSHGFTTLSLITFRHLPWNARFYEKFGFVPLDRHEMGPAMQQILSEEAEAGIEVANRIGMRRLLPS